MRVYKKKTIRRMKWYGVILVLSGIPLGIGMGRSLEEGRTFLLEESQTYAQKLYLPLFSYQKEQESEREEIFRLPLHVWMPLAGYLEDQTEKRGKEEPAEVLEDEETIAWILQCQANDEHTVDEEGKLVGADPETQESAVEQPVPGMDLSIERLRDLYTHIERHGARLVVFNHRCPHALLGGDVERWVHHVAREVDITSLDDIERLERDDG